MEGRTFGRYRLVELLGRGGMGEVWRASDTAANDRTVAIKLLPAHLAGDDTFVQRFRREAEAAAQLSNKHVIPIHNYGEIDGQLYVDMRLIEGRDLQTVLAAGPLPVEGALRIVEQVAKALQAAHRAGLVHRDVKPSNILLDEDDDAYLIDFGLAVGATQTGLTQTGTTIGSWHYMAPERFRVGEVDARADVYALACVLYECLTGARPFPGDTLENQVAAHLTDPPPRPSAVQPEVPAGIDDVIAKGMAKKPEDRYSSAAELAAAARAALGNPDGRTVVHAAPPVLGPGSGRPAMPPTASPPVLEQPSAGEPDSAKPDRRRRAVVIGGVIAAVVALVLAFALGTRMVGTPEPREPAAASPPSATAPAPGGATAPGSAPAPGGTPPDAGRTAEVSFTQVGYSLNVRLRNPYSDVGLVRSPFELALLDDAGAVLAIAGQSGMPGSAVSTIYQLPPGGEFGIDLSAPKDKTVASVELTVLGEWLPWDTVNPPTVSLTDAAVVTDTGYSGPSVTGRLVLDGDEPLNVVVIAFVKTAVGTVVSRVTMECVAAGQSRAFETSNSDDARGPYELESIVAYPTSVPGVEPPPPDYQPTC